MSRGLGSIVMSAMVCAATACGSSSITASRIERAIAPTFGNLVRTQMSWLGLPPLIASDFAVRVSCHRLGADVHAGSGEWTCAVIWQSPDRRLIRDSYELFVTTEGCYTATASRENVGGPMLKAEDGRDVRNLLYAFEGCFDTT